MLYRCSHMNLYRSRNLTHWWIVLIASVLSVNTALGASFWFAPEGCEYEVCFPNKPTITRQYVDGVGYISTASGGTQGDENSTVVLIAEGMPIDPAFIQGVDRKAFLLERAQQYAAFNGLEHVEHSFEESRIGVVIVSRGGKIVGGVRVLYMSKIILGQKSALMLRGGGAAVSYPQEGMLEFMGSVKVRS